MSMCPGRFSDETLKRLQVATTRDGLAASETLWPYRCNICGRGGLMPMDDGLEWRPSSHEPFSPKSENRSGTVQRLASESHKYTAANQKPNGKSGSLSTTAGLAHEVFRH